MGKGAQKACEASLTKSLLTMPGRGKDQTIDKVEFWALHPLGWNMEKRDL